MGNQDGQSYVEGEAISVFLVFFASLLAVVLVLSNYLHETPTLAAVFPEAAMVLAVGIVAGFFIHLVADQFKDQDIDDELSALLSFNPDIFFIALLPPIIFNSGLRIGPLFFRHLAPILSFAILGTTISALSIAGILKIVSNFGLCGGFEPSTAELLAFGSLLSSTDPISVLAVFQAKKVDPQVFYLVFGESVLSDAIAIVLFHAFSKFIVAQNDDDAFDDDGVDDDAKLIAAGIGDFLLDFFLNSVCSLCLGVAFTLFTAKLLKQIDLRNTRLVEISFYLLMVYIPFLLAQIMHLSGIVTILFTGIAANRYVVPNLSSITQVNADMLFRLLAHLAETSINLELGLSVFGLTDHWNWTFIGWSLLASFIARAMNVYPIAFFYNSSLLCNSKKRKGFWKSQTKKKATFGNPELSETFDSIAHKILDQGIVDLASLSQDSDVTDVRTCKTDATATPFNRKDLKIRPKTQHMLWFTGLRGAVAYACVRTFPEDLDHTKDFTMTTMAVILFTTFLLGGCSEIVLSLLKINIGVDEETYMRETLREPVVSSVLSDFGEYFQYPKITDMDLPCLLHLTHLLLGNLQKIATFFLLLYETSNSRIIWQTAKLTTSTIEDGNALLRLSHRSSRL